ncbi:MAG TPA: aspartate aminotransferase [Microbacterium sp.]|nr:aspartate aminotransferase [Microbacterium sp.]
MTSNRLSLDRGSGRPLYRQLREALEHEIAAGQLDPRRPLPSSRELSRELGISRNTVNTAYQELEAEGFVEAQPRRGLFVNREMLGEIRRGTAAAIPTGPVNWTAHLNESPDRSLAEIAKIPDWHRYPYPFVAGQVDSSSFPRLAWLRALREALEPPHLHFSLRDGIDEDDPELVDQLCRHVLPARGIEVDPDHVMITLGSQQGLDLLAHTLLGPGSVVGVEEPGYLDARHIFLRAGAQLRPFRVDGSGLVPPDELAGVALLHLTPSHHSPSNVTLSIARRRQLLAMAQRDDTLLVEDDYDSEFRYQGSPTPALKALPDNERVIYLGTFSKFLAPGIRLGYLVAAPALVAELRRQRRYRVRHASGHIQRAMALLIESGQYHRTVRRRRTNLARRWSTLRDSLQEHLAWPVDPPPGGVSIWLPGPPGLDCVELSDRAAAHGVVIERGDIYFTDPARHRNFIRLGFAALPLSQIEPGVAVLARLAREQLGG